MTERFPRPFWIILCIYISLLAANEVSKLIGSRSPAEIITVQGEAEIAAVPDLAAMLLTVITEESEPGKIQRVHTEKMALLAGAIKAQGIDAKDMQTTQYQLEPVYQYPDNRPPQLAGYRILQTLSVKIRDFKQLNRVQAESSRLSVHRIDGPTFEISDMEMRKHDARKLAFARARQKAASLAEAAGKSLGRMVRFSDRTPAAVSASVLHTPKRVASSEEDANDNPPALLPVENSEAPESLASRGGV